MVSILQGNVAAAFAADKVVMVERLEEVVSVTLIGDVHKRLTFASTEDAKTAITLFAKKIP